LALEVLVMLLAASVQGLSGFGFAVVAVPLLATIASLDHAIALSSLLGLWASANTVRTCRSEIRWPIVGNVLRGTAVGLPFGILGLWLLDTRQLTVTTGIIVLALAVSIAVGLRIVCVNPLAQSATGVLSGAIGLCTGMTGPPVVIGMRGANLEPGEMRATLALTLGLTGIATLSIRAIGGHVPADVLPMVLLGIPTVVVGNFLGRRAFDRFSGRTYHAVVVGLLAVSGLVALIPR